MSRALRELVKSLGALLVIYLFAYLIDSFGGGYWMHFQRDGEHRFFWGLSMRDAILWQPRYGHQSVGDDDFLGILFSPLMELDRKYIHRTHYRDDADFDDWVNHVARSQVHPECREKFLKDRENRPSE